MDTYIQVFKSKSRFSKLYLKICIGFMLIGIMGLSVSVILEMPFIPFLNEAGYFVLLFNGLISYWIVWDSMKKEKYFIAWNRTEINYLLPKTDTTETIVIESIKTVDLNPGEVTIGLKNGETKRINLNYFFFPERKTIIDFFEGMR